MLIDVYILYICGNSNYYSMKRTLVLSFLFFLCSIAFAQTYDLDLSATMLSKNGNWKKGAHVNIKKFVHQTVVDDYGILVESFYLEDDLGGKVEISSKVNDCFEFQFDNIQQLWDANIITNVLYNLKKKGFQYDLRADMESDALEYIQKVKSYGLEFNDPFLESYIYSLVAKIAPTQLIDGRPGSINILIQENPTLNAGCYPNGTIVLNTGLIASLHSEDELVAILAHEIAHFVLDHSVQNVNAAISRQKRAEFWAALATGLTAVAEGYAASQNVYYVPGAATMSMAILSTSIASHIVERLGMEYNHEQENEADKLAVQALKILGYNENALATALARLEGEYVRERNNAMYINSYTHPALMERIFNAGTVLDFQDEKFEEIISFAVSSVATMKYSDRRFRQCLPYVNQNIENGVATADDYILKANCLLSTKSDYASNQEALELVNIAKGIDADNINIYKSEIIATLRLEDKAKALELLNNYITTLDSYNLDNIKSDNSWERLRDFIIVEKTWAKKMIIKLNGMQ